MRTIVRTSSSTPVAAPKPRPACAGADPAQFFAHALSTLQIARAKALCATCPLIASCLEGALERGEEYGVWGGLTEDERRSLKRRAVRGQIASAA
ncbi:WhiB family transcriptional regulator [Streptomyces sp. NBC_01264]|uniref:WhiB family transcriptional regulator n=1 Tax=Streptomyces sp. NBC_01264 TaxID=2903804 RepID=UPI002259A255|nr:WhiB family transcriptional regulator [Streptomyces sp. NBC_01264]MCX4784463.1 WhiB family transcriptional regulator [Streptomyces sp. NBC_01264]